MGKCIEGMMKKKMLVSIEEYNYDEKDVVFGSKLGPRLERIRDGFANSD